MANFVDSQFTVKDILEYISTHTEESINLDFKRGDALRNDDKCKKEISKDVSSFANSDGGIIIYGIEEQDHKASALHYLNGNVITKEWLEQVINTNIHRKIPGLKIDPIRFENDTEKTVYAVKIPRSVNAPHMANDKKFYRRYNFEAVPMEEYEVRNLYFQQEKTDLDIVDPAPKVSYGATIGGIPKDFYTYLQIDVINKGKAIEKLYKVEFSIPSNLTGGIYSAFNSPTLKHHVRNKDGYSIYSFPNESPLFQDEIASVEPIRFNLTIQNFESLKNEPIIIRLLYTNGTVVKEILLYDYLSFNDEKLTFDLLRGI